MSGRCEVEQRGTPTWSDLSILSRKRQVAMALTGQPMSESSLSPGKMDFTTFSIEAVRCMGGAKLNVAEFRFSPMCRRGSGAGVGNRAQGGKTCEGCWDDDSERKCSDVHYVYPSVR